MGQAFLPKAVKRYTVTPNKQAGVLNWDIDNAYPQRVKDIIQSSPTTDVCNSVYTDFITGLGFPDVGTMEVNYKGQTLNEIHRLVSADYGEWGGFALHINFNANGQAVTLQHVPLEYGRFKLPEDELCPPDKIKLYPDWDKQKKSQMQNKYLKEYDFFGAEVPTDNILSYTGQIYYFSNQGYRVYPRPKCDSVLEYAIIEGRIPVFMLNGVENSFNPSAIYIHKGKFENDQAKEDFYSVMGEFQGPEQVNKIMVVEVENTELVPELLDIPNNNIDALWTKTEETCENKIQRVYGAPSPLIAKEVSGKLGNANEMNDAYQYYNIRTANERKVLSEAFKQIFAIWHQPVASEFEIQTLQYGNGETNLSLAEKLDVGTAVELKNLLTDTTITWARVRYIAKLLYNQDLPETPPVV